MTNGFVWDRFPAFCGSLVGGYHLLVLGLKAAIIAIVTRLHRHGHGGNVVRWQRITRPVAAFCSAWISLEVFNARRRSLHGDDRLPQSASSAIHHEKGVATTIEPYGRSIDLTLFTAARAMDCLAQVFQGECKPRNRRHQKRLLFAERRNSVMDPLIFASSAGVIMWAWFYQPLSLPKSYNKWIAQAARVDSRLVQVLRNARDGVFVYGQENDQSSILRGMCEEYEWPAEWADPSKTIPVPCQMVHMGAGPSCHWHAVVRFVETFKFAIKMYLPLQLLLKSSKLSMKAARKVMEESVRSSLFLSTFVALFYYGVCMSRTLVGPQLNRILGLSPMFWDSGACIAAGSVLCGWSVLVEDGKRRQEMAMFVLPRAFATLFPRQYTRKVRQTSQALIKCSIDTSAGICHREIGILYERCFAFYRISRPSESNTWRIRPGSEHRFINGKRPRQG